MEEQQEMTPETGGSSKLRTFIQENLRVITSVFIVAVIAIGIYSYSDRSVPSEDVSVAGEVTSSETEKIAEEDGTESEEEMTERETADDHEAEAVRTADTHHDKHAHEQNAHEHDTPAESSRETESAFVESAERGDGLTHLARRATTHYLEKNTDSSLTPEHRVYIEDYLRKKIEHEGDIRVGTSVAFSKDLIREAIDASKRLDDRQLENLKRYSNRVSAFR